MANVHRIHNPTKPSDALKKRITKLERALKLQAEYTDNHMLGQADLERAVQRLDRIANVLIEANAIHRKRFDDLQCSVAQLEREVELVASRLAPRRTLQGVSLHETLPTWGDEEYPAQEFAPWPISAHSADWIGLENMGTD